MRVALACLVVLMSAVAAHAAATHGLSNKCQFNTAISCNIALTGVNAGDAIIVTFKTDGNRTMASASDGTNTYSTPVNLGSGPYIGYAYACNAASGNPTVTVTLNSTGGLGGAVAHVIRGAASASCLDVFNNQRQTSVGTGTDAVSSGLSGLPANSGSYIFGFTGKNCCAASTVTAGTNFTLDQSINDSGSVAWSEHYEQGAAASIAATFTQSSGTGPTFHTLVLVIKPAQTLTIGSGVDNTCNAASCSTAGMTSTSGSAFMLWVSHHDSGCAISNVQDSKGNSYLQLGVDRTVSGGGGARIRQFYSTTGNGGTSHTFTVNLSASCLASIWAAEIKGTNLAIDQHNSNTDASSPFTSPSITTTQATALLIGFIAEGSISGTCTHTHGNSFTQITEQTNCLTEWTGATSYRSVGSTGSYNTSVTVSGTFTDTANFITAWYEGSGGGGASTSFFHRRVMQ